MTAVRCGNCPNPANCSPTFCHWADADVFEAAHAKAAALFCKPDGMPVAMYEPPAPAKPLPLHIRILDRIGNWWDDLNELGRISSVVGLIAVCAVVGLIGVEVMR